MSLMPRFARLLFPALLAVLVIWWFASARRDARLETPAVVAQVRQLHELSTVRYTVQKVVALREQKTPIGSEEILLVAQARVEAGVDLASLREADVEVRRDGSVRIRLPQARVLNVAIDEKETKVWDRSKTWWTPWVPFSRDLEQRARLQAIEEARKAALDMGILGQAQRNAEQSIRSLLMLAGVKSVVFEASAAS